MKAKKAEETLPSPRNTQTLTKAQKRPAKIKPAAAAGASKKLRKEPNRAMPSPTPPASQPQQNPAGSSSLPLPEEVSLSFDGALELDGWSWGAVDEEKLLGWFPFVDEDFPCFCSENRGGSSGFFWEDYSDIWHLKHIHEIPSSANR
ncbi:hypothetical protein KFK09_028447 [Dendrobium nobile]|uniref:Uncharacterized protein n=2 Tax=Dendrobium TaxID=37818 RepID=A0A8T3A2I0_DENNO|nr:hypothetical protein KFK09_028447 [Dendrobium nobile]PKU75800.1 hypothetical protein MA16_Dca020871 [Dendrobium catenatum]